MVRNKEMNIRATIFWLKDKWVGRGRVKASYSDVEKYVAVGDDNMAQLEKIIKWASEEVPYYEEYKGRPFCEFPIVNKSIIRGDYDRFKAKSFLGTKLHAESTSGSTGTPFTIYQDAGKRMRASADSLYFADMAGFHLGTKLYYVRVWTDMNKKSPLQCKLKNIVMQDSKSLSEGNLESFLKRLEADKSEKSILSYANTITAMYRWMKETGRKTTACVSSIITMSESLPPEVKEGMQELFGCPVVSRYSNQECGMVSQQRKDGEEYVINTGSFFVEVLHLDSNEPVEDGVLGRIVITDLYNKAMPLLRYDTGDLGVMSHISKSGKAGKYLAKVEGRSNDFIYSTKGEMLSPVTISVGMWKYNDLIQWLFIQQEKGNYEMQLKTLNPPYAKEDELVADLKSFVGEDANIQIVYVDDIPLLKSGKRKYVVNMMKN